MLSAERAKVHAERESQHRKWADEAVHPNAKQSHLAMAEMHAEAARAEAAAALLS